MLRNFFERVRKANLSLKPSKCKIGFAKVDFLGHTKKEDTISPQIETVGRILDTDRPKTKKSMPQSARNGKFLSQIHT